MRLTNPKFMGGLHYNYGDRAVLKGGIEFGAEPTSLVDRSGLGNDGAFVSDAVLNPLQLASGLWYFPFTGASNEYIDCGNDASLALTGATSLVTWAKLTASGSPQVFISKGENGTTYGLLLYGNTTTGVVVFGDNAGAKFTTTAYNDGTWHLVIGTHTGSNNFAGLSIYVDGALQATTEAGTFNGAEATTQNLAIGGHFDDGVIEKNLTGSLALPRIFPYALTQAQIKKMYNKERKLFNV